MSEKSESKVRSDLGHPSLQHDNQLIEHFEYKTNKLFVLSPGALGGQKKREIFFF